MSITIRAFVRRDPLHFGFTNPWRVSAFAFDDETETVSHLRLAVRPSMPEALQAVQSLRAEVSRLLMDDVYESSSRVQRCGACRDLGGEHTRSGDCQHRECAGCGHTRWQHSAGGFAGQCCSFLPGRLATCHCPEFTTKRRQPVVIGPEMETTA